MIIAEPSHSSAASPLCCDDYDVEFVVPFQLEPFLASRAKGVVARQGLRDQSFMTFFDREIEEPWDLLLVLLDYPWGQIILPYQGGQDLPSFRVSLVDQGSSVHIECVEEVNLQRNPFGHGLYLMDAAKSSH